LLNQRKETARVSAVLEFEVEDRLRVFEEYAQETTSEDGLEGLGSPQQFRRAPIRAKEIRRLFSASTYRKQDALEVDRVSKSI
jgi:hypothetical protein